MNIAAEMTALAELLDAHVSRMVTADPTKTGNTPCVLIDLPEIDPTTAHLCGQMLATFPVWVIGQPGALPELVPLSQLVDETLSALETVGLGYTRIVPGAYAHMADTGTSDPSVAYTITVERFI